MATILSPEDGEDRDFTSDPGSKSGRCSYPPSRIEWMGLRSSQSHPQLEDGSAYRQLRPTKLDKIKNLYHCVRLGAVISHHLYATWRSALPRVGTEGLRRSFNPCSASGCNSPNRRIPLKDRQLAIRPNTFRLNTPSRECTHPAMLTRVWDSVLTGAKQGEFLVHQLLFVPHDSPPFIYFPLGHGYDKAPLPPTPQIGAPVHRC